jgi:tetratricopeptide (TPR) repeat protein
MTLTADIAGRYYRLGLAAAKRRDLSAALRYADLARLLKPQDRTNAPVQGDALYENGEVYKNGEPEQDDAARLAEICRHELGSGAVNDGMEQVAALAEQKKWQAAAKAAKAIPRQNVRVLNIQGCLWALAKRYARAADCFAASLAKDRGNRLAADALAEIGKQRKYFWRFF